jgi:hypothetical protein
LKSDRKTGVFGLENSNTNNLPPGFNTRMSSWIPASTLARFRNPKAIVAASKAWPANGNSSASPSMKGSETPFLKAFDFAI